MPVQWGMPVKFNSKGLPTVFVRPIAGDHKADKPTDEYFTCEITHVLWAPEDVPEALEDERPTFLDPTDPRD